MNAYNFLSRYLLIMTFKWLANQIKICHSTKKHLGFGSFRNTKVNKLYKIVITYSFLKFIQTLKQKINDQKSWWKNTNQRTPPVNKYLTLLFAMGVAFG